MPVDSATINPVNIVTIGAFATVVVGGLMAFIYWMVKQHEKERKEVRSEMAGLVLVSSEAMKKVSTSNDSLKISVDNLAERSKAESDYATLMLEVLKRVNTHDSPPSPKA